MVWSSTIQDSLFWWELVWLELFSEDLLPLAFKQALITTSLQKKKKTLLNLMNTPSQILPFMAQRGVKSNPQPPEANAIWFFSPALFGNCSEVPRGQLLVKSNGWFYFFLCWLQSYLSLPLLSSPRPRYLTFHHLPLLLCLSYPSDYCFQLLWLLALISVSICGYIFSSHCSHEGLYYFHYLYSFIHSFFY